MGRVIECFDVESWRAQRLLFVAPHPDDDVLACGGTLARAAFEGAASRVVYVTDGAASHLASKTYPPARLRELREREALAGLAILGVASTDARFLREPDSGLARGGPRAGELAARLAAQLEAFRPTAVFSPWIRDAHPDHVATSSAVRRALALVDLGTVLYEYGVWLHDLGTAADAPLEGEVEACSVDVAAFRSRKACAVAAHRSQLGQLIHDAEHAFALPESVLQRADVDVEQFYRIALSHRERTYA